MRTPDPTLTEEERNPHQVNARRRGQTQKEFPTQPLYQRLRIRE